MELVVLVGLPGSGKSTYYFKHFADTHVQVSKDLMKNAAKREGKEQQMIEAALREGRSVVVDNTNPSSQVREPLIQLGRRYGARLVAIFFDVPANVAVARNRKRETGRVPDVAIFVTKAKLRPPTREEGFDEVIVIKDETSPQQPLF